MPNLRAEIAPAPPPLDTELGPSHWITITQDMIDQFGLLTRDPDPMHVDPTWAEQNGPYGGSIAFGFLTLSLLTHLLHDAVGSTPQAEQRAPGHFLNYGFDRLRFVSPVPVGARIRGVFRVSDRAIDARGRWLTTFDCKIEIEGQERPALVADWLSIWVPPKA